MVARGSDKNLFGLQRFRTRGFGQNRDRPFADTKRKAVLDKNLRSFGQNAVPPNRSGSNKITHNLSYTLSLFMRLLMTDFYECIFVNCSASASVLYIKPICRIQNIPFFLYKKSFNFK